MTSRQPAEWMPHAAVWLAWPSHPDLWQDNLDPARAEVAALAHAIADPDEMGCARGERLEILVANAEAAASAERILGPLSARIHRVPFGDIWLRDTAPIFAISANGELRAADFRFNGWGGKYILEGDDVVGVKIAALAQVPVRSHDWILEGGAIDTDGAGLVVTTEQCLLNPNRNPGLGRTQIEACLKGGLGLDRVLWLGNGLVNDHTDGHVDNLARFVAENVLALPEALDADDPNRDIYLDARRRAEAFGVDVVTIPSPGRVEGDDGHVAPASYMNFYISNTAVIIPIYGTRYDDKAVETVGQLFPGRRAIGLSAKHVLTGGGSFHCITQQQPAL